MAGGALPGTRRISSLVPFHVLAKIFPGQWLSASDPQRNVAAAIAAAADITDEIHADPASVPASLTVCQTWRKLAAISTSSILLAEKSTASRR